MLTCRTLSQRIQQHTAQCLCPLSLEVTRLQFQLQRVIKSITQFTCLQESWLTQPVVLVVTLFSQSRSFPFQKVLFLICYHTQIRLTSSHSEQEASREASFPKILPTIISRLSRSCICTPQGRNDNSGGCQMSRWPLPSRYLWSWAVDSWLSRASLVGSYRSGLVPKVCPHFFFWFCSQ